MPAASTAATAPTAPTAPSTLRTVHPAPSIGGGDATRRASAFRRPPRCAAWLGLGARPAALIAPLLLLAIPLLAQAQSAPVRWVYPDAFAANVSRATTIAIQFGQAMDAASVEAALALDPPAPGQLRWANPAHVELVPDEPLLPGRVYFVALKATAKDSSGQPILTQPLGWSFTTSGEQRQVRFSRGLPVQLVTPAGGRGVPVQPGAPRTVFECRLFSLDPAAFMARYQALQPGQVNDIDVAGLSPAATWTARVDAGAAAGAIQPPAGTAPGLYVLETASERVGTARTLLIYHDAVPVAKVGRTGQTVWLSRLPDGTPVPGAAVTWYNGLGAPLGTDTTDELGVAQLADAADAAFAFAKVDGGLTVVGLDGYWSSATQSGDYGQPGSLPRTPDFIGHVHTDRPIYRPGHTVHFKASVRRLTGDGPQVPAPGTSVAITFRDGAGNAAGRAEATLDEFGSAVGELVLADDVALGTWRVEVQAGSDTVTGGFEVQDYVKPDFAVTVTTDRPYYVRDEAATITVNGQYYFGQPVAGADVTLRIYRGRYSRSSNPWRQLSGKLDGDGNWSTALVLPGYSYSERWFFEAEVMDATRRPVVAEADVMLHPAAFALSARARRYGVRSGEPLVVDVRTTVHDGTPAAGRSVDLNLRRWYYGSAYQRNETVVTGDDGSVELSLSDLDIGWYYITARAKDDVGHEVTATSYAWLYDPSRSWGATNTLSVSADRDSYAEGDTARLLVRSPVETLALITLERDEVLAEWVAPVSSAGAVEVPITADLVPGVTARVTLWQPQNNASGDRAEGVMRTATVDLVVPATDKRLTVEVLPEAGPHGPREEATFTVRVRDAAGQPVRAQVSFAVVDASVLALAADLSGDPLAAFWSPRAASIVTHDGLRLSHWLVRYEPAPYARPPDPFMPTAEPGTGTVTPDPGATSPPGTPTASAMPTGTAGPTGTLPPAAPTGTPGAPGGPGGEQAAEAVAPRREFPDTAYWAGDLVTDENGELVVTVQLPDTLTTWKAIARAITLKTEVGQGAAELVVTQPVIADPALPRFAVQGDQFALDVLGRNYAGGTLDGVCSLEAPGLFMLDAGTRYMTLPFNETRVARWSVVASELGENPVTARLTTDAGSDAIELPLNVAPFTAPERHVVSGSTTDLAELDIDIPFNAAPDASTVTVYLAQGIALGIIDGAEGLIGYPYGCVEQTMSRMLPNAVVGRLVLALDLPAPGIVARLPEYMAVGLQKLYGYQNADGSWGWWRTDGNLYITAYVLHGLTLAGQAGYPADPDVLDRGFAWLSAQVDRETDPRLRAYGVFVMAEAERARHEQVLAVWAARDQLDAFSLGAAALALQQVGETAAAQEALDLLVGQALVTETSASWPATDRGSVYYWRTMSSADKSTAMALLALARLRPDSELAPKAARWLMEHRTGRGWSNTQATAFAMLALTDYILASGELFAEYDWTVAFDGLAVAEGQVDSTTRLTTVPPVRLSGTPLTPGPHTLTLAKSGQGTLFYTVVTELALYHEVQSPVAAAGEGLSLSRAYTPISGRSEAGGWKVGDVVNVRLTLTTEGELWYVLVEDMLPAGLEALNEALDTESGRVPGGGSPWRWWGYERKEIRADRVTLFATRLRAGTHTFDYAARAVTPGTFSARPAQAYAMYRPEVWARSASDRVEVAIQEVADRPSLVGDFDRDCRLTGFDTQLVAADWSAAQGPRPHRRRPGHGG